MTTYYGALSSLAFQFKTDKGPEGHGFTRFYEAFLRDRRISTRSVLEIGIHTGASLRMWEAYFPQARIYGIDINPIPWPLAGRIVVGFADQSDPKKLRAVADSFGPPFDLIVDDGGHTMPQQQITLGTLWPLLAPGGIYILEDLHTSLAERPEEWGINAERTNTTLDVVQHLIDGSPVDLAAIHLSPLEVARIRHQLDHGWIFENGPTMEDRVPSITSVLRRKVSL